MRKRLRILIIDDEKFNVELLKKHLDDAECISAYSGEEGWEKLQSETDVDIILLDRMMPGLDGLSLLKRIKQDKRFKHIPVVLETVMSEEKDIIDGISNGAYYYLVKPFTGNMVQAVVNAAYEEAVMHKLILREMGNNSKFLKQLKKGEFQFKTLEEARRLGNQIAEIFPDPEKVRQGLSEILINGVEHGNLEISYEEKKRLMLSGDLEFEIKKRLKLPNYSEKICTLKVIHNDDYIELCVKDQGQGFDWKQYMDFSDERLTDPNGKGIKIALMSFDELKFKGNGNEVILKSFHK